jgi:translation initiation factor 1 (eIF-1/SUI1)
VWWAGATPVENESIARANNVDLFLNAIGSREGHHFYWDESLHGNTKSDWYYARGPALTMLIYGAIGIALLTVLSFSRRRGPVRDVPLPARSTPVEFIEALGSLYAKAGASATSVQLAYDRFRRAMGALCGVKGMQMDARSLADALRRRFPAAGAELETDLVECETACNDDLLVPKKALAIVQKLSRWETFFADQAAAGAKHAGEPRRKAG